MLIGGGRREEVSGGLRRTTRRRTDLMAAVAALEPLIWPARVMIYTNSRYLAKAMVEGWAERWRANGWKRSRKAYVADCDLWRALLALVKRHEVVEFQRGQDCAGDPDNQRCRRLAVEASRAGEPPDDPGYERQVERAAAQLRLFD